MAGGGAISYPRFLLFELIGGGAWAGLFIAVGYLLGAPARALIERRGWGLPLAIIAGLTVRSAPLAIILVRLARRRRHGPAGSTTS